MNADEQAWWGETHKALNAIILKPREHARSVDLFLDLHAAVHASSISGLKEPTLDDDVFHELKESVFRTYPVQLPNTKNSVAWHLWHITRIEDMTMSILVADTSQELHSGDWIERLNTWFTHSGNEMSTDEVAELSGTLHLAALKSYREAVGRRTRELVSGLEPGAFKEKVNPQRIARLFAEHAVTPEAAWLAEYWGKKNIGGLILMPATRHIFMHLKKCMHIKEKFAKTSTQL
ncbi:DinB family protein [Paenibacillus sp. NFR01]|uniref:DinB family protein n=1 Tax=Paenibacillus sp. NFR01 TaxID=1566279 RepID=UPI0008B4FCF0|nr:DinB family protein [Paenibacillus sp. NFR01]SET15090.1 DinB superfamily protein [Paenibacillus sp. NFR01]